MSTFISKKEKKVEHSGPKDKIAFFNVAMSKNSSGSTWFLRSVSLGFWEIFVCKNVFGFSSRWSEMPFLKYQDGIAVVCRVLQAEWFHEVDSGEILMSFLSFGYILLSFCLFAFLSFCPFVFLSFYLFVFFRCMPSGFTRLTCGWDLQQRRSWNPPAQGLVQAVKWGRRHKTK